MSMALAQFANCALMAASFDKFANPLQALLLLLTSGHGTELCP